MKQYLSLFLIFSICWVGMCSTAVGQNIQHEIKGMVTDAESGEPLPGVNISVKETTIGTSTDAEGAYRLAVPSANDTLVFSFIGYKTQEVPVNGRTTIDVAMVSEALIGEELIVTGYTSQKQSDISGAVSTVNMEDISNIPAGNVMSTLQGRVPGVSVVTDGTPGGVGTSATIRGITTINNSSPLYVVDGVQTRANIATLLNSNDIESIQVLKDAASASIYGTKAANGVIIITTKKAEANQIQVDFSTKLSSQFFYTGFEMLDAQQWGEVYWQAYKNDGIQPSHDLYGSGDEPVIPEYIDEAETIPAGDTNWADEVYKTSFLQDYNLRVSKGTENGSSTFSLNYFDQEGLIDHTSFERFNARFNSSYNFLDDRLRVGENLNISKWDEVLKPEGIEELTIAQHPIIPVYDINGGYAGPTQGIGDKPNPVRLLDQQKDNKNKRWRIFGNVFVEFELLDSLVFRSDFGLNYFNNYESNFQPKWSEGNRSVDKNILNTYSSWKRDWVWSNTLVYNFDINENHTGNVLVGMESKEKESEWLSGRRDDFIIEALEYRYLSAGDGQQTNGGSGLRTAMNSYFGKVNYSYMDRYLFSGTIRHDASSRFGTNDNAAIFPAVSIGWRISQEPFFESVDWISKLKVRTSWGQNGNDQINSVATYTLYETNLSMAGYDINGNNQGVIPSGIIKQRTGNPDIKWEITTQTNVGIDLGMLENRFLLSLDYFIKDTDDMLIDRPYIAVMGEGGTMAYNGASLRNKGVEATATWRDNIGDDFNYNLTFTASVYRNKVTSLPEDIYYTWGGGNGIDKSIVGQPLGSWLGYKTDGLYRTKEELNNGIDQPGKGLGRIRYVDVNEDGVIDSADRTWLGSDQPKFAGGLNINVSYKSFELSVFLNGKVRDVWNSAKFYTDFFQLWTGNHSTRLLNAWDKDENFDSDIPALTAVNTNDEGRPSKYFIEDGSYLKMKSLRIGYRLPADFTSRLGMRSMQVYVHGQDLLTVTKFTGPDPEIPGYTYPIPRTLSVGLNVSL